MLADTRRAAAGAGAPSYDGPPAGDPLVFHGASILAELEAMQATGLSAADVVVAATRNGARAMGRAKDFGTLEAGKLADLLVLAEDPRRDVRAFRSATYVMRAGNLYDRAALAQRD
jgi:imidazolonepropionase-like amidohydrolase